jgi:hypothetical protein
MQERKAATSSPMSLIATATSRLRNPRPIRPLMVLTLVFAASRLVFYAVGVRFDISALDGPPIAHPWQLLDSDLLRHHLLGSIWYLQSQPPIFNLFCGILLRIPSDRQQLFAMLIYQGFGLALVLSAFQSMVDLKVPRWAAMVVAILVLLDPSSILYENWLSYAYLTASVLSVSVLCCIRYLKTERWYWGAAFFSTIGIVVLLDSTYQWPWMVMALVIVGWAQRRRWKQVAMVAICPVIVVASWYVKDYVQFGTLSTSSWLGMNLAQTTLRTGPPATIDQLVRRGTLTTLAKIPAFSSVTAYAPKWVELPHTGVRALDALRKSDGTINYDNLAYVKVSSLYLRQDLAYIRAEPVGYLKTVSKAGLLWLEPADEYGFVKHNDSRIETWTRLFDRVVILQPGNNENAPVAAILEGKGPTPLQIPYVTVLVFLLALLGSPIAAFRLRRRDRASAPALCYLWFTVLFAYAVSSLTEFAENERMRFELGPLPIVAATTVVAMAFWTRHRGQEQSPRSAVRMNREPVDGFQRGAPRCL